MTECKQEFDLAALLRNVSELDTGNAPGREQIEYIDLELIDGDPANFYELSKIDSLASNIALIGLQQPLRVKPNPDAAGRWRIVSGHRRRAALQKLVEEGREDYLKVACIKEAGEGSAALQELRLIFANSDTRKMSSADENRQAERVEALLYQLKEEGYEFPGRMRDHVAEVCKMSRTKIARLKVIRDGLAGGWAARYQKGNLKESSAYALAQLPKEHQTAIYEKIGEGYVYEEMIKLHGERLAKIDALTCGRSKQPCANRERKYRAAMNFQYWQTVPCTKCCNKCEKLGSCKYACPKLAEKVKQLKADAKAQRAQEKLAQEERERPTIQKIQKYWKRFGQARNAADASVKQYYEAADMYYCSTENEKVVNLECLEAKFSTYTNLPYGYNCTLSDVGRYVKIADLFGCSLDYLLCRTDDPKGFAAQAEATAASGCSTPSQSPAATALPGGEPMRWKAGSESPEKAGLYAAKFSIEGLDKPMKKLAWFDGKSWRFSNGGPEIKAECTGWYPLPEDEA